MHERDILKIKAIQFKDIHDWATFKKARNSLSNEIKLAHYMNAFHENDSNVKKTWNIINELTSRKQYDSHVKDIKLNGSSISDPPGLSEEFNTHFTSTVIFNCSINAGISFDEWKCSKVIPLSKHGERGDLNSYRPILIILIVVKVFELIIYDQIYAFLTDNNLISNSQA